jgi:Recombination endonuclease VII
MRDRRAQLKEDDLCVSCGQNPPNKDSTLCAGCLLQRRIYARGLRKRRREEFIENCHICLKPIAGKDAKLDHCHKKGHCRGWLCARCNMMLGLAGDSVELLRQAIRYLEKDRDGQTMDYSSKARDLLIAKKKPLHG